MKIIHLEMSFAKEIMSFNKIRQQQELDQLKVW